MSLIKCQVSTMQDDWLLMNIYIYARSAFHQEQWEETQHRYLRQSTKAAKRRPWTTKMSRGGWDPNTWLDLRRPLAEWAGSGSGSGIPTPDRVWPSVPPLLVSLSVSLSAVSLSRLLDHLMDWPMPMKWRQTGERSNNTLHCASNAAVCIVSCVSVMLSISLSDVSSPIKTPPPSTNTLAGSTHDAMQQTVSWLTRCLLPIRDWFSSV